MAKERKITVKHYLNTRLRPDSIGYPVYIRVSYSRKNERIKSVWISHTQSSLDQSKQIIDLVKYETDVITKGIELLNYDEDIKIGSLLNLLLDRFASGIFGFDFFDSKKFEEQLTKYIEKTTKIKGNYFRVYRKDDIDSESYKTIVQANGVHKTMHPYILYYSLLLDFQELYYNVDTSDVFGHLVGCELTNYDWLFGGAKDEFIEYAKSQKLLTGEFIITNSERLTKLYINSLKYWSKMNIG